MHPSRLLAWIDAPEQVEPCLDACLAAGMALGATGIEAFSRRDVGCDHAFRPGSGPPDANGGAPHPGQDPAEAVKRWRRDHPHAPVVHCRIVDQVAQADWTRQASHASLVVVSAGAVVTDALTRRVLFDAGRPLMWVPEGWKGRAAGFPHVAIGVERNASERSALFAATPWLSAAERITAIRIGELDLSHEQPAREELFDGVEPEWRCVDRDPGKTLGEQIVAEAEAVHADLLVCGAYRFSGLLEWLLGGTTQELMARATLPILMAHGT